MKLNCHPRHFSCYLTNLHSIFAFFLVGLLRTKSFRAQKVPFNAKIRKKEPRLRCRCCCINNTQQRQRNGHSNSVKMLPQILTVKFFANRQPFKQPPQQNMAFVWRNTDQWQQYSINILRYIYCLQDGSTSNIWTVQLERSFRCFVCSILNYIYWFCERKKTFYS